MNIIENMDYVRNDAVKMGISPDYLPPPVQDIIFRTFGAFLLINFVSYIVIRTITHYMEKEETLLPLNEPKPSNTLKRLMTLKEESDEDDEDHASPPPLKRTRFEEEEDDKIGKPLESWYRLLESTLQLEEKERSMNIPHPQFRTQIPPLPISPPNSDSE